MLLLADAIFFWIGLGLLGICPRGFTAVPPILTSVDFLGGLFAAVDHFGSGDDQRSAADPVEGCAVSTDPSGFGRSGTHHVKNLSR